MVECKALFIGSSSCVNLVGAVRVARSLGAGHTVAWGSLRNKHSTDVASPRRLRASASAFTVMVSHAPISVECFFSMILNPKP